VLKMYDNRLNERKMNWVKRLRHRYYIDKQIEKEFNLEADLSKETTDEIEKALWDLKSTLGLPAEEIEVAIESRKNFRIRNLETIRKKNTDNLDN